MKYDIVIVGGGHAGCEASNAASKMGYKTALITANKKNIADMPCNPSIGGTAKGIVVREIDALGGLMGKVADKTHIQIKMLNNAKGPAVRSLRAQGDKITYPKEMLKQLERIKILDIIEGMVENILTENNKVRGVELSDGSLIYCDALILTTGTYLRSKILVGDKSKEEGPHGEKRSNYLSNKLAEYGFEIQRLKTGTPQRIERSSIDFSKLQAENGDDCYWTFSFDDVPSYDKEKQEKCYIVYPNSKPHEIIKNNLTKSAMYGGYAEGIGPRYCPSIEDKVVRFSDKERHQLFLEPESLYYDDIYLQGFSTSMPEDVQEEMVHSLPGLENAIIKKYAYAIEYDAINPLQLKPNLETKIIENLFTAGQINGTSGYEEAAGQGIIAGINAGLKLANKEPLILKRNESYIGVLIDDLVTKGAKEPYRLLTSRAEYRLLLRHDNADIRLRKYGYNVGLINENQKQKLDQKINEINELTNILKNKRITPTTIPDEFKEKINLKSGVSIYNLLKRPEIKIEDIYIFDKTIPQYSNEILEQVSFNIKYEGYLLKEENEVQKLLKLEEKEIPSDIDYDKVKNLASEAKTKLKLIRPRTIAQATRISGVNPVDISVLTIYLKKEYPNE